MLEEIHAGQPGAKREKIVINGDNVCVYALDVPEWGEDVRADGLVIGKRRNGESWVCFVEMKSKGENKARQKAVYQLLNTVWHFSYRRVCDGCVRMDQEGNPAPWHGDYHHQQWEAGEDQLTIMPDAEHRVVALIIAHRRGDRTSNIPARNLHIAGEDICQRKPIKLREIFLPKDQIYTTYKTFEEFLRSAGIR